MFELVEIHVMWTWATTAIVSVRAGASRGERGEVGQYVVMVAILVVAAAAIATIIAKKFTDKANSISTE